jgi:hypothetical protein
LIDVEAQSLSNFEQAAAASRENAPSRLAIFTQSNLPLEFAERLSSSRSAVTLEFVKFLQKIYGTGGPTLAACRYRKISSHRKIFANA